MTDGELLAHSAAMCRTAHDIMASLRLMEHWSRHGRPVLVGAVAHDLVWGPDIDLEVYCPSLRVEDGFAVLAACSAVATEGPCAVLGAEYGNFLNGPDGALYWRLRIGTADGTEWKVDMWSAPDDYALPRGERLVAPLRRAMTEEVRVAVLRLKHLREQGALPECLSIDLYRAVLDGGVRSVEDFRAWAAGNTLGGLTGWTPAAAVA